MPSAKARSAGRLTGRLPEGAELVRIGERLNATRYLQVSRDLVEPDWTLMYLTPVDPVMSAARSATVAAAFAFAFACLLLFYWRQRRLRMMEMLRSRRMLETAYDQLERRVEDRTADLMATNEQLQHEIIDRTRSNVVEETLRLTGGRGVDLIMDCVGGPNVTALFKCLERFGLLMLYGQIEGMASGDIIKSIHCPPWRSGAFRYFTMHTLDDWPELRARATLDLARQTAARQQELWKDGLTTKESLERARCARDQTAAEVRERDAVARAAADALPKRSSTAKTRWPSSMAVT